MRSITFIAIVALAATQGMGIPPQISLILNPRFHPKGFVAPLIKVLSDVVRATGTPLGKTHQTACRILEFRRHIIVCPKRNITLLSPRTRIMKPSKHVAFKCLGILTWTRASCLSRRYWSIDIGGAQLWGIVTYMMCLDFTGLQTRWDLGVVGMSYCLAFLAHCGCRKVRNL